MSRVFNPQGTAVWIDLDKISTVYAPRVVDGASGTRLIHMYVVLFEERQPVIISRKAAGISVTFSEYEKFFDDTFRALISRWSGYTCSAKASDFFYSSN